MAGQEHKNGGIFFHPKGGPVLMFISVCVCVFSWFGMLSRMLFSGESLGRPKSSTKKHCYLRIKKKNLKTANYTPLRIKQLQTLPFCFLVKIIADSLAGNQVFLNSQF